MLVKCNSKQVSDCVLDDDIHEIVMESYHYLFAWSPEVRDESPRTVFYAVKRESMAKSICDLFTTEYADANGNPSFSFKDGASFSIAEQVLMDESLESLVIYDDPDPGIYDPPPPVSVIKLAQYALRARKWEQLLRDRIGDLESDVDSEKEEAEQKHDSPTDDLPGMSAEEKRNSGLILLMLLAQAYYKMLESSISMASWCSALDIELNQSYLWTVTMITNLLKNHEDLRDFPVTFEPIFPDRGDPQQRNLEQIEMIEIQPQGVVRDRWAAVMLRTTMTTVPATSTLSLLNFHAAPVSALCINFCLLLQRRPFRNQIRFPNTSLLKRKCGSGIALW